MAIFFIAKITFGEYFYFIGKKNPIIGKKKKPMGGGWWATFWFFKSLDINMIYTLCLDVYVCIYKSVHNNFVMGLILLKSWRPHLTKIKIP